MTVNEIKQATRSFVFLRFPPYTAEDVKTPFLSPLPLFWSRSALPLHVAKRRLAPRNESSGAMLARVWGEAAAVKLL